MGSFAFAPLKVPPLPTPSPLGAPTELYPEWLDYLLVTTFLERFSFSEVILFRSQNLLHFLLGWLSFLGFAVWVGSCFRWRHHPKSFHHHQPQMILHSLIHLFSFFCVFACK